MKAALINRYGSNDAVIVADTALPAMGATDVLVRVHAASVNPVDIKTRRYGVARWFYPSDAAAALDWNRFAVEGVRRVRGATFGTMVQVIRTDTLRGKTIRMRGFRLCRSGYVVSYWSVRN